MAPFRSTSRGWFSHGFKGVHLTSRYEYYNDRFGFTTGTGQHVNEFAETLERKVAGNLITRLEYRRDMSNRPSLFKGTIPVDYQDTILAGLIYTFDLKELH